MKELYIFDTETASLQGGICELAYLKVNSKLEVLDEFCSFVNPERAIEDGARKVHGITDEQVANAPTLAMLKQTLPLMQGEVDVAGHSCAFDLRMTKGYVTAKISLCTLKLARKYLKEPSNKLQDLQASLNLPVQKSHSALGDVHTCRDLLEHIIQISGIDLAALAARELEPSMVNKMPFGKYKGLATVTLPKDYRKWLLSQDIEKDLRYTLSKLENI